MTGVDPRDARLDALRGFALFGILLVNIQSYLSGSTNAIGYLTAEAGPADRVAFFLTAALVAGKFMPLFGMLFGASFALLYDKLRATVVDPRGIYRRRLVFLLIFGVLHGLFLYFGDITHAYAIAGFVLLRHADADADSVARATVRWWIVAVAWLLLLIAASSGEPEVASIESLEEVYLNVAASSRLGYWEQWPLRARMFLWQVQSNLLGLPTVIALMMTGMLAQRAGWLRDPHVPAWRPAARLGLWLGLPAGLVYGGWSVTHAEIENGLALPAVQILVLTVSLSLSFFYVATFLRRASPLVITWLAPAGRMALTNYLAQSVAMGLLLSGWGFGIDTLAYWQLSAVAIAIFMLQLVASRWWLGRHAQGPLEAMWRAWTYRGALRPSAAG
ncbi:MAG TPA: DUF418 domain-containing protein [Burkholderiaceae bacterium]|nr:DUF418 domain-containing protein [Burkholderiaceae bacterium]